MRAVATAALLALAALAVAGLSSADEDADLALIPKDIRDEPAAPPAEKAPAAKASTGARPKLHLEDAFAFATRPRTVAVPYPSTPFELQNRTSLDVYLQWEPDRRLRFTLSDRLNVLEQDNAAFASRQTLRNDFREGYVTWEPAPRSYLEIGRVNIRNGASLGYNPTDFFKTRTLVGQASLDPSALRQNRLGTLMVRAETIWEGGSSSVSFAPKLAAPSPVVGADPLGIDPRFDATNAANRLLCTLGFDVADLSPQILAYFEDHRTKIGLNVTRPIGDAVVAYAEWAGGPEATLAARAVDYGRSTGTLPAAAPVLPPADGGSAFRSDAAAGASWTIAARVTLNAEYHFHQSGFTSRDWRNWFDIGGAPGAPSAVTGELWLVRAYASDQQEPATAHQIFLRADWPRALMNELELSGFAFVNLLDGSVLGQLALDYYLSDAWTLAAYASVSAGAARSERGSLPQLATGILQVVRYL
jgi:hypothetical protein